MARPSMPKRTRSRSPIRTIACPLCEARLIRLARGGIADICEFPLVAVLGPVDRVPGDDDAVADGLLNQRRQRLEVEPERDLDGLIARGRRDGVAAGSWGRQRAQS